MESAGTRRRGKKGPLVVLAMVVALGAIVSKVPEMLRATQALPGSGAELKAVRREQIIKFVPPGAHRKESWALPASRGVFGAQDSKTTSGANLKVDEDVGDAMRAFVEPAQADGWALEVVECSRLLNRSLMRFTKSTGTFQLKLEVTTDLQPDYIRASIVVESGSANHPAPAPAPPAPSTAGILDTGVTRSDPGCLATRRPDTAPPITTPAWSGPQVCALVTTAWPTAVVEPEGQFCWLQVDGILLSVETLSSADPYYLEDERQSPAGDERHFALVKGGFFAVRDDGTALLARVRDGSPPLTEDAALALAVAAQRAPAA